MEYQDLKKYCLMVLLVACLGQCKKSYNPPAVTTINNFLIVDGVINIAGNSISTIKLKRTRNLGDSVQESIPELHAFAQIIGSGGDKYQLSESSDSGIYESSPLSLDVNRQYAVEIVTSDGRKYASDPVICKPTPAIDSIYWRQPDDLSYYVDTHDETNATRYYRWDYVETWAHDATLVTPWALQNGLVVPADSSNQTTYCWTTRHSSDVLLGTSIALSKDEIRGMKLEQIPMKDERVNKRYSLLVHQYALTEAAYNYWSLIKKTSQQLGSLFDLQPAQLSGNLHCLTNPDEPVIGYISASTIQEKRVFIYNTYLTNWGHNPLGYSCDTLSVPVNRSDYRIYSYPDTTFAPYYFVSNGPLVLASKICLDCRSFGGTNIKPTFW